MQDCCFSFKKKKTAINAGPVKKIKNVKIKQSDWKIYPGFY